jgi:serine/threonine protein kinase
MFTFFRCMLEAVLTNGVQGLLEMVPGGKYVYDIGADAFKRYSEKKNRQKIEDGVKEMIAASKQEVKAAVQELVEEVVPRLSKREKELVTQYLTALPESARQSMIRKEDPTGQTLPVGYAIHSAADFVKLLPQYPPRFAAGEDVQGLPDWALDQQLGVGGCGEVWLARNRSNRSECGALKYAHPERVALLRHEAGLIRQLMIAGNHPNIVRLLKANIEQETPWLLYEYVPGKLDLAGWIRNLQSKPVAARIKQALLALGQLSSAIAHFHQLSPPIVHRDLKPCNILVDPVSKKLKITDFGIGAVAAKAAITEESKGITTGVARQTTLLRGAHTPLYASPQQRNGADPNPRDDVHALGVIAFQLLTGDLTRAPGTDYKLELSFLGVNTGLTDLIGECVSHNPSLRPANGRVLQQLVQAITSPSLSGDESNPPAKTNRKPSTNTKRTERRDLEEDDEEDDTPSTSAVRESDIENQPRGRRLRSVWLIPVAVVSLIFFSVILLANSNSKPKQDSQTNGRTGNDEHANIKENPIATSPSTGGTSKTKSLATPPPSPKDPPLPKKSSEFNINNVQESLRWFGEQEDKMRINATGNGYAFQLKQQENKMIIKNVCSLVVGQTINWSVKVELVDQKGHVHIASILAKSGSGYLTGIRLWV